MDPKLKKFLELSKAQRELYPGWIIAPKKTRDTIWHYTERWVNYVYSSLQSLSPPEDLYLLYELIWRFEISLTPILLEHTEIISSIIKKYNPFPELINNTEATITPNKSNKQLWDWDFIKKCWMEIFFALIKEARDDQDEKRFNEWLNIIKDTVKEKDEWKSKYYYEQCLFYMFQFNYEKVKHIIQEWPKNSNLPFWEVKRASILAELGELEEAEKIAENSLKKVRSQIRPNKKNYTVLSQEGWTMLLLKIIKESNYLGVLENEYSDRWNFLEKDACNPRNEIEKLDLVLKQSPKQTEKVKKNFDPNSVNVSYKFFDESFDMYNFRAGFEFLRIFEEGALPFHCGIMNIFSDTVENATRWIEMFASDWALGALFRTEDIKRIDNFSRINIALFEKDKIDKLYLNFKELLLYCINILTKNTLNNSAQNKICFSLEILSRLTFKLSKEQLTDILDLSIQIYKADIFRKNHFFYDAINNLFKRTL